MRLLHVRDDLVIVKNVSLLKGFALELFCKKKTIKEMLERVASAFLLYIFLKYSSKGMFLVFLFC